MPVGRDAFPEDSALHLRDLVLDLTSRAVSSGQNKVILRKLFVAVRRVLSTVSCIRRRYLGQITSLAIKLHPGNPSRWPDWLRASIDVLSSLGVPREHLLDFLAIVAEEMEGADLLPANKFGSIIQ